MELILIIATTLYGILAVFLKMGMVRASSINENDSFKPTVSIILPARNEEAHLRACLQSLTKIDYPRDNLEVIIVNDSSIDRTQEIAQEMVRTHAWMKLITTRQGEGNLQGKLNALSAGIDHSRGEILILTDADCTVLPTWEHETVWCFSEDTGIVGGFTLLRADRAF